jgi:hypothetical protein
VLARHEEEANIPKQFGLVDGHDIINVFRLNPGPQIGKLLEAVREAQAAGEVTDRQQALLYIERFLAQDDTSGTNLIKE